MQSYLVILFDQLDCFLNALFGGEYDQTISLRLAEAAQKKKFIGCVLCKWLHWSLRQNHCKRILDGEPISGWAAVMAAVQLLIIFVLIFYGPLWLFCGYN